MNNLLLPNECTALIDTNDRTIMNATAFSSARGWSHADGICLRMGFNTILPPNSPSCIARASDPYGFLSASSFHSGGVNVLRVDGTVQFVSDTINCGDQSYNVTAGTTSHPSDGLEPIGESPYGVWGALGSIIGGESVAP